MLSGSPSGPLLRPATAKSYSSHSFKPSTATKGSSFNDTNRTQKVTTQQEDSRIRPISFLTAVNAGLDKELSTFRKDYNIDHLVNIEGSINAARQVKN